MGGARGVRWLADRKAFMQKLQCRVCLARHAQPRLAVAFASWVESVASRKAGDDPMAMRCTEPT